MPRRKHNKQKKKGKPKTRKPRLKLPKPKEKLTTKLRVSLLVGTAIVGIGVAGTAANWERFHITEDAVAKTTEEKTHKSPLDNPEARRMIEAVRSFNRSQGSSGLALSSTKRPFTKLKESKKQVRDTTFESFKHMFAGPAMSFEEAAGKIRKATGVGIKRYSFKLPDPYHLTTTKRFYSTNLYNIILPSQDGSAKWEFVPLGSNHVFDTHAHNEEDGRIAALASYILSKNKCSVENPEQAVKTMAWWVMNNIKMDMWGQEFQQGKESSEDFLKRQGYGITNNHRDSLSILNTSGICMDYVNLIADLLNSVGIPSRNILVSTNGYPNGVPPNKDAVVTHAHSVLETTTASKTSYYEVTPMRENDRIALIALLRIGSLADFAMASFKAQYPSNDVFRALCLRSLPEERLATYPGLKEALDMDMKGIKMITAFTKTPSGKKKLKGFLKGVARELIIVFKDRFVKAWRASRVR